MKLNISTLLAVAALLCSSVSANLTSSEKHELLDLHKSARRAVGAVDMESIEWDDSLAASAEAYAAKCKKGVHDRNQQNLAWTEGKRDVAHLFGLWTNEKDDFLKSGQVSNFSGKKYNGNAIGHYSQVVWSSVTKVGCGLSECKGFYQLVCHYDEGNLIGSKVYEGGERGKTEKKTTTKKTTTTTKKTTTTTTKKTTTTTTIKKTTAKATTIAKITTIPRLTTKNLVTTKTTMNKLAFGTAKLGTVTPVATPIVKGTKDTKKVNGKEDTSKESTKKETADQTNNQIIDIEGNDEKGNGVVTGVAITGSVVGAAAAFVFLKKNPKQYEKLSRSLSRKASSVKRGASVVTRRLTTKRTNTNVPEHNNDAYNINYRVDFAESMQV
ncbi:PR-1-like protein [Anaeromyces robustus]|jgi:hypothetical protein|uniref:PR-1-like protein n=1 Tax=Anaeromyces robustus TaxID=1754192 RepID=A0A1Y1XHQ4_9FUNG|nr:PR-1-like protein [Anaeromyces robustus]|eukprot:ORX85275.1 PR-1-like protein [Anaeromyces robustus]